VKNFIFLPYITVVTQGRSENRFTLLLCLAIAEKGEVSRSGGMKKEADREYIKTPPLCFLQENRGEVPRREGVKKRNEKGG